MTVNTQRGSVLFYILLGVVLFAALSYLVMGMLRGTGDGGSSEQAKLQAQAIVDYAQQLKIISQDMKLRGVAVDQFSFLQPADAGYATAPHTAKIFHPLGGGAPIANLNDAFADGATKRFDVARIINLGTGTTAAEMVFGIRGLRKDVCENLNRQLRNTATIPNETVTYAALFSTLPNGNAGACSSCINRSQQCFYSSTGTEYIFFSVLDIN
jgi:hypothetical protein